MLQRMLFPMVHQMTNLRHLQHHLNNIREKSQLLETQLMMNNQNQEMIKMSKDLWMMRAHPCCLLFPCRMTENKMKNKQITMIQFMTKMRDLTIKMNKEILLMYENNPAIDRSHLILSKGSLSEGNSMTQQQNNNKGFKKILIG